MSKEVSNIHVALAEVNRGLKAVGKTQTNAHFKYNFRGIDDVMNNLHPLLAQHGVVLATVDMQYNIAVRETVNKNGYARVERMADVKIVYRFTAEDGSFIETVGIGMGQDDSDKALNKAQVQALKYALLTLFSIPTEDMDESDASGPAQEVAPSAYDASPGAKRLLATYAKQNGVDAKDKDKMVALSEKCMGVPMDDLANTIAGLCKGAE